MTLLPSFNGNETRTKSEIQTSLDCRLTGVKRLATLNPNFFLFRRVGFRKDMGGKCIQISRTHVETFITMSRICG